MATEQLDLFSDITFQEAPECPLLGRKVVLTGEFSVGRQSMRSMLLKLGAAEVKYDKPSRSTHIVVVGENAQSETLNYVNLYRHDGYNIQTLTAIDIQNIKDGNYAPYTIEREMKKNLRITSDVVWWEMPEIAGLKSVRTSTPLDLNAQQAPIYGKELFVHESIFQEMPTLFQLIGNLGGYANTVIDDDTDAIVIPKSLPRNVCRAVEDYYNQSKSVAFNTPFILLEDLIKYLS